MHKDDCENVEAAPASNVIYGVDFRKDKDLHSMVDTFSLFGTVAPWNFNDHACSEINPDSGDCA